MAFMACWVAANWPIPGAAAMPWVELMKTMSPWRRTSCGSSA